MKREDDFVEEDWEREATKEHMYMIERQMEEDEAYWRWWEEQQEKQQPERKPARIEVVKPKPADYEDITDPFFVQGNNR